jgi:hypothetical protein
MLEKVIEGARKRGITFTTYARQADSAVAQHEVAETALQIDSAWLQVMHAAVEVEDIAAEGKPMDYVARARVRGLVGYAAKLIREAIDALLPSAVREDSRIQARSSECGAMPASRCDMDWSQPTLGLEIYGRALAYLPQFEG